LSEAIAKNWAAIGASNKRPNLCAPTTPSGPQASEDHHLAESRDYRRKLAAKNGKIIAGSVEDYRQRAMRRKVAPHAAGMECCPHEGRMSDRLANQSHPSPPSAYAGTAESARGPGAGWLPSAWWCGDHPRRRCSCTGQAGRRRNCTRSLRHAPAQGSTFLTFVLALAVAAAVFALVLALVLATAAVFTLVLVGLAVLAVVPVAVAVIVIRLSGRCDFRGRSRTSSRARAADLLQIFEHSLPHRADLSGALVGQFAGSSGARQVRLQVIQRVDRRSGRCAEPPSRSLSPFSF